MATAVRATLRLLGPACGGDCAGACSTAPIAMVSSRIVVAKAELNRHLFRDQARRALNPPVSRSMVWGSLIPPSLSLSQKRQGPDLRSATVLL